MHLNALRYLTQTALETVIEVCCNEVIRTFNITLLELFIRIGGVTIRISISVLVEYLEIMCLDTSSE